MPKVVSPKVWPTSSQLLYEMGRTRVYAFCILNEIPIPKVAAISKGDWCFDACGYYRPDDEIERRWGWLEKKGHVLGINVNLERCGRPCSEFEIRNWTWPGSVTDREPYGVLAHELGHHCDWYASGKKGRYFGDYSTRMEKESGEPKLTSYCPNPAEWFAEMFRLFVTNPGLLRCLRPKTFSLLERRWSPVGTMDWRWVLGTNVPPKIVKTLINKGAK